MKTSGSSGILKTSDSYDDEAKREDLLLSVTLISTEQLPKYSVERFYMLSELSENAHSTHFLCDISNEESTLETEDTSTASVEQAAATTTTTTTTNHRPDFPRFILLYLLWTPDMTNSAQVFAETFLLDAISKLQNMVDIVPSTEASTHIQGIVASPPSSSPSQEEDATEEQEEDATEEREEEVSFETCQRCASIYVVVDRLSQPEKQEWSDDEEFAEAQHRFHQVQEDLVEQLARQVASHAQLRNWVEGITVGVSNHERAAPGLEACLNAVHVGAKDRRQYHTTDEDTKSWLGIVTDRPDCLLGLQAEHVVDAAQDVLQSRICAEWNGQGNLPTFSSRAHAAWRLHHGLPMIQLEPVLRKKRVPRIQRLSPLPEMSYHDEAAMDRAAEEFLYDVFGAVCIALYVYFHYSESLREIFWMLDPTGLEGMLVAFLRGL